MTPEKAHELLNGATQGRRVQYHPSYCKEAEGAPFSDWDTSHEMSVIRPDGTRYRLAHYKHAMDAYLSQMAPEIAEAYLKAVEGLAEAERRAEALGMRKAAEIITGHSDAARKKLSATYDKGDTIENALWGCIVTHLDIAHDSIRAAANALDPPCPDTETAVKG